MLDDFVCEAIVASVDSRTHPTARGRNEGIRILEEHRPEDTESPRDLNDFTALVNMPLEVLEVRIGEHLVVHGSGLTTNDWAEKRLVARNWWRSHRQALRAVLNANPDLLNNLFSSSDFDRTAAVARLLPLLSSNGSGLPVVCLLALTCHYGAIQLRAESDDTNSEAG